MVPVQVPNKAFVILLTRIFSVTKIGAVLSPILAIPRNITASTFVPPSMLLVKVTVEGAETHSFLLLAHVPSTLTTPILPILVVPRVRLAGTVTV